MNYLYVLVHLFVCLFIILSYSFIYL